MPIDDKFPDDFLYFVIAVNDRPWYADLVNYLASAVVPSQASKIQICKLKSDAKYYIWDDPYLWKMCSDQILRRCVHDSEIRNILFCCHNTLVGGHVGPQRTAKRVLDSGFYWPTIFEDAYNVVKECAECQKAGGVITRRNEMPQQSIIFCEVFDVWGIDFMGPFPNSVGFSYILMAVEYVSRWVEAKATRTNNSKTVSDFIRTHIFCRFGVPKVVISDKGSHFCNKVLAALFQKYGVQHRTSTLYHP